MFATVEIYEPENTFKEKIRNFFRMPKIYSEKIELPEDEYFYKLKVPLYKGKLPYDKLQDITTSLGEGLIFPVGFEVSENAGVKIFRPRYLKKLMLFNTAVSMLKNSVFDPTKTILTLIDARGELTGELYRLVPFACEIRVVTMCKQRYEAESEKLMNEYGLSLFVTDKPDEGVKDSSAVISHHSSFMPLSYKGVLFTNEKRLLPFGKVLVGQGVKVNERYLDMCPEKIDKITFLSALYEAAFVRELHSAEFKKLVDISGIKI